MSGVEVDGQQWEDGWVGVDQDGTLWQLRFFPSHWAAVYDRWVWHEFGVRLEQPLESELVKHPLTKVWPQSTSDAEKPPAKRRAS